MRKLYKKSPWNKRSLGNAISNPREAQKIIKKIPRIKIEKGDIIEAEKISILFCFPPSLNGCYRSYRGRVIKSDAYRCWQHIQMKFYKDDKRRVTGKIKIEVTVHTGKGWRANRDLDNLLKPLLDTLILIGFIEDDNSKVLREIVINMNVPKVKSAGLLEVNITKL